MESESHKLLTKAVVEWLTELHSGFALKDHKENIAAVSIEADYLSDMEFIDVQGGLIGHGRDNPHKTERRTIDDAAHTSVPEISFTTFNHFIDIRKGEGIFDDYDGYSYKRGSGCKGQYQESKAAAENVWTCFICGLLGKKVDEGVNWWFNDEYVHAPGHKWYRNCSPAIERYSFYREKGIYAGIEEEAAARFPVAGAVGENGQGIPYSVFLPVDNLARYWYGKFQETAEPRHLGMIMHAVQDASILHHAAGCLGNWHGRYEKELERHINDWLNRDGFKAGAVALYREWNHIDPAPPVHLSVQDYDRVPGKNWSIDMLVTWMALNAYRSYERVYNCFSRGYSFDEKDAQDITMQAAALCMLILKKASGMPAHAPS